jgi:hypothetical protein
LCLVKNITLRTYVGFFFFLKDENRNRGGNVNVKNFLNCCSRSLKIPVTPSQWKPSNK